MTTLAVAVGLALCATPALTQERVIQACDDSCPLAVSIHVTLGDTLRATDGYVGRPTDLYRSSDGRFLLADRLDPGSPKIFSPTGEYVGRLGRHGRGPGEFQLVNLFLRLPADSVEVIDIGLMRGTLLSPSLELVRTTPRPGIIASGVRTAAGQYITSGRVNRPSSFGLPLHVVSAAGQIERSFGADPPIRNAAVEHLFLRDLAPSTRPEAFWAAHATRYVLEEWQADGQLVRRLVRKADWFPPQERYDWGDPTEEPTPILRAFHMDDRGRLWVAVAVPDEEWRSAYSSRTDVYGRERLMPDFNRAYDTIIEIVDPERAVIVGRARIDGYVRGFAGDALPYVLQESRAGEPFVVVLELNEGT